MNAIRIGNTRPTTIERSESFDLHSEYAKDDYVIKVWFPDDYEGSNQLFPVLYLLDGDFAFGMATDIVQYLIYGRHIPNLVIVSPAYGTKKGPDEGGSNKRGSDLLHTMPPWAGIIPGLSEVPMRGAQFMQCMLHEIIPTVETRYRIDPTDRTLSGYSAGGMFVTYALFQTEGVFTRMVLVDGCRDDEMPMLEEQYAATHTDLSMRFFMSSCPGQNCEGQLVERLKARGYPNLHAEYFCQEVAGHFAAPADGLARGLVAVFKGWDTDRTDGQVQDC
jgi:enterochelin esterase-like enzyme